MPQVGGKHAAHQHLSRTHTSTHVPAPQVKSFPKNQAVEQSAMRFADALYPLVRDLQVESVAPLASKVVALGATGDPKEIIKTIDTGLDAFLSVPAERFFAVSNVLSNMIQGLAKEPSTRLLKHIIRCYLRLSENARARDALRHCLPEQLWDPVCVSVCARGHG